MKYHQKYGRQENSTTYCSDTVMPYISRTQKRDGQKAAFSSFPKKGDLEIAKNYRGITFTSIAAKIYHALLLNYIELEIEKILWKNQNSFQKNRSKIYNSPKKLSQP